MDSRRICPRSRLWTAEFRDTICRVKADMSSFSVVQYTLKDEENDLIIKCKRDSLFGHTLSVFGILRKEGVMDFENKVVIVTGGASGIGKATCFAFAAKGAEVVCIDNDQAAGFSLMHKLCTDWHQSPIKFFELDVSDPVQTEYLMNLILNNYGRVDVLVNNAAIQPLESYVPLHLMPNDLWDSILDVNLKGYFLMAKHCIPFMLEQGVGVIINIASVHAFATAKCTSAYAASKAAIVSLTRSIALEYGDKNIRSVAICPGAVDTPLVRRTLSAQTHGMSPEQAKKQLDKAHPIGRIGMPEEIAATVLFCAGPGASFMTGCAMMVDGGLVAKGSWAVE